MSLEPSAHELHRPADDDWREIDELIDDVARLAVADLSLRQFHEGLLERAVRGLAAVGGAIWIRNAAGKIQLECHVHLDALPLAENWADAQRHTRLLDAALSAGQSRVVAPLANLAGESQTANPTTYLLLLAPLAVDAGERGLIEVFQRPEIAPGAERGYLRFLAALDELAADFQRNRQLGQLRDREALWGRFQRFAEQAHSSLDLRTTAYTIANEGRGLIECDRLSVGVLRGGKCKLLATSGVDRFDPRAPSVRLMEQLASAVLAIDEPLWREDGQAPAAPQIEGPLQALLDETHARAVAVVPLHGTADVDRESAASSEGAGSHRPLGVLIIERFDAGAFDIPQRQRIGAVAKQSALALSNAQTYQSVPFLPWLRALGSTRWFIEARRLPKTVAALAIAAVVILALAIIPADFTVTARGHLQPKDRREVFAPADGIVAEVKVQHGDVVAKGAVLGQLHRPQLDFESSRLAGELQTAQERLKSIESARSATGREGPNTPDKINQAAAEEEELKVLVANLAGQQKLLQQQQDELELHSPLAGTVLTWDAGQLLTARPVARGQSLLTVADLLGKWEIEVPVPDDRIGHILTAQEQREEQAKASHTRKPGDDQLDVSFILAVEPGKSYAGQIERVALAADTDKTAGTTVMVTVSFDPGEIPADELRPGASVIAKIYCGKRSIGYVWLHELWETIESRVLF